MTNGGQREDGTVALVTGATRGLGRAIAGQLAQAGATVLVGARDAARGRAVADELSADGGTVSVLHLDVTDQATVDAAAEEVERRYGRLDALVNNAGVMIDDDPPAVIAADVVAAIFATNVVGVVRVTNAFVPLLRRSQAGCIVNLSSQAGSLVLLNTPGHPASTVGRLGYSSSKAALNALTSVYAATLRADGILVNSVCPGFVDTDLNHHKGTRPVDEAARLPVALAMLGPDGPTGTFVDSDGPVPW
jgi:NAD(P)-dependent dehydrogenase (short-subunit alcohol dehydrogenase family)